MDTQETAPERETGIRLPVAYSHGGFAQMRHVAALDQACPLAPIAITEALANAAAPPSAAAATPQGLQDQGFAARETFAAVSALSPNRPLLRTLEPP